MTPLFLYIEDGQGERVEVVRQLPIVMGRSATCDIKLDRDTVSPRHVRLEMGPEGVRLVDLGSLNGLYLAGKRQAEVAVGQGVSVQCGDLRLEVCLAERLTPTTKLAGPGSASAPGHQVVLAMAKIAACYAALLSVTALKQFASYWPPERSVELFTKSLFIWCMVLVGATFLSLFSQMQNRQYRLVRFVVVLTALVVAINIFAEGIDTVVYNVRLGPLRLLVQHLSLLTILGFGLWGLLTTIYPRWRSRRQWLTALGLAILIDAGFSGYDYYEYREGDRQVRDEQIGLPLVPASIGAVSTVALQGRLTASMGVIDGYRTVRQAELKAEDGPASPPPTD